MYRLTKKFLVYFDKKYIYVYIYTLIEKRMNNSILELIERVSICSTDREKVFRVRGRAARVDFIKKNRIYIFPLPSMRHGQ